MRFLQSTTIAALLAAAPAALAQGGRCEGGSGTRVADLGFESISCRHCSMEFDAGGPVRYEFRAEPRLNDITRPGEGRLREDDLLVAVDGRLITTVEGARRLKDARRGQTVRLSVRRGGEVRDVTVTAGERCMMPARAPLPPVPPRAPTPPRPPLTPTPARAPHAPAPPRAPSVPRPPRAPAAPLPPLPPMAPLAPLPPAPPELLPEGWFGFGISCERCSVRSEGHNPPEFRFQSNPVVERVEQGSPADRAGLRRGDVLTHVDGVVLASAQGSRRFGDLRPGQTVSWTYRRGSRAYTARITAVRRPDAVTPAVAPRAATAQRLRYSGAVGDTEVEVRGAPVNVTRDERTGELVIRSRDLTVRVRPDPDSN
ncbi:MAG TPA: PDZ domain-containing protein [Longimicrobiaceae bacterium]|nr:PDZ domain-containing protein [Longimicrobiaceae bacterium]